MRATMAWPADTSPYTLVLLTFLTELFVYKVVCPVVMRQFQSYRVAKPGVQQRLNLYPASMLVTAVENVLSLYVFFFNSDVSPYRYEPNLTVRQASGMLLGRVFAELLVTFREGKFEADILAHHLVFLVTISQGLFIGRMPWHMNSLGYMMELSNPFHNIRLILLDLGLKTSRVYVINGICFVVVFFLCRIATIPLFWYYTLPMILSGRIFEFDWLTIAANVTHPVFQLFNIYWFGKMVRTVSKFARGGKKEL